MYTGVISGDALGVEEVRVLEEVRGREGKGEMLAFSIAFRRLVSGSLLFTSR